MRSRAQRGFLAGSAKLGTTEYRRSGALTFGQADKLGTTEER